MKVDEAEAKRLAADPNVASVVQDTKVWLSVTQTNPVWGLDRIDQPALPLDTSYTSPDSAGGGVLAYVIDIGIRASHQDFGGRASSGWDFQDVTAQDSKDTRASFPNWGPRLDIFGATITSAWNTRDTATQSISGTSMAIPRASGAAAVYLAGYPSANPAGVSRT
ncbi:hypothetical protein AS594_39910 [Streptomyces agglomeratus]|uniref:Peptidase S8/S53 domain-containing protein n=1 Tax=Streptomyces agglomeratus TaxID=285458 RepID=A0A1E5NZC7_9ACTN|nr:S8 family serine peptidase [Streptomyces agglomeratus]OEJ21673.1 hypothetical protein AS594_39910 [Streptomyces agglomeratus]